MAITQDKAPSSRSRDLNGYMTVTGNPISKTGVYQYLGSEIAGHDLPPDEVFGVYRPEEELNNEETIASFRLMPFIDEHEVLGDNATAPERKGIQGYIGENVYFDSPYLRGNIMIPSRSAQTAIESGKIELSPAYRCSYEKKDGVFDGEPYQFIQRGIRANHLALVAEGRTGPDVAVLDHRTIITIDSLRIKPMDFTNEQIEQLKALILEIMASQAAVDESKEDEPAADVETVEDTETVEDAEATETEEDKPAEDAEAETAMDGLRAEIAKLKSKPVVTADAMISMVADRDELYGKVSKFIGAFDHARMTADGVTAFATKQIGIANSRVALDAWLHGRKPESDRIVAQDGRNTGESIDNLWGAK